MGGGRQVFKFFAGEDVDRNKMDLGVTVFASLRGGHFDDLAGAGLDDDEAVLPQGGTLHGIGGRGAGIGTLEGVLMLRYRRSARSRSAGISPQQWGSEPEPEP